jgi:hypothetical protein
MPVASVWQPYHVQIVLTVPGWYGPVGVAEAELDVLLVLLEILVLVETLEDEVDEL